MLPTQSPGLDEASVLMALHALGATTPGMAIERTSLHGVSESILDTLIARGVVRTTDSPRYVYLDTAMAERLGSRRRLLSRAKWIMFGLVPVGLIALFVLGRMIIG